MQIKPLAILMTFALAAPLAHAAAETPPPNVNLLVPLPITCPR